MRLVFFLASAVAIAGEYTTYIGDIYPRSVSAMTTDAAGNAYIVGNRGAAGTPMAVLIAGLIPITGFPGFRSAPGDVFVSKLDPTGKVLFTDVFAGKGVDQGLAVAVDPSGNIYVGGTTTSPDFPVSNALQRQPSQSGTGFIVKISPEGKTILYSTYFGGLNGLTSVNAMTTDASGNLYLTGTTFASDFPHTGGMPYYAAQTQPNPSAYTAPSLATAFVTAISAAGDKILFSGSVGGASWTCNPVHDCSGLSISTAGIGLALSWCGW